MPTRICHVTSLHGAFDARIFRLECKSLVKRYEVFLVAPNIESQVVDGIHIVGISLPGTRKRLQRWLSLRRIIPVLNRIDATVYHFHDPELMSWGLRLKKKGKKVIFDSHEDVPASITEKDWIPAFFRKPISFVYRKYEERKFRQYDALVSVTPSIVDRIKKRNPRTYQITNYPALKEFKGNERTWQNNICFTGGISAQWMHDIIIRSIEGLNVKYVLAGKGEGNYIESLKALPGWSNVDYRGLVKPSEVFQIHKSSFAGLSLNDYVANVGYHLGSLGNTKLFEYMMSGIPVIATDFILWKEIFDKYECGICVNPRDVDSIRQAIQYLHQNPEEAKRMGNNGRRAVEEAYNWSTQEVILFNMYDDVLKK